MKGGGDYVRVPRGTEESVQGKFDQDTLFIVSLQ